MIAHVSLSDLQRNADRYTSEAHDEFDKFAPGWRDKVSTDMNQNALRAALIQYWCDKVMELDLPQARHWELITGDHGQRLYWLILLARNDLAHELWSKGSVRRLKRPHLISNSDDVQIHISRRSRGNDGALGRYAEQPSN